MTLAQELAIQLVKTRQVIAYALWLLVFILTVDTCVAIAHNTLFRYKGFKRKIIISIIVISLTVVRIVVEIAAGLEILSSILVVVLISIYAMQLAFFRKQTRRKTKK